MKAFDDEVVPVGEVDDRDPRNHVDSNLNQIPKVFQKGKFFFLQSAEYFDGEINHGEKVENRSHEHEQIEA